MKFFTNLDLCRHFHAGVIEASRQQAKTQPTAISGSADKVSSSGDHQEEIGDLIASFQSEHVAKEEIRKSKSSSVLSLSNKYSRPFNFLRKHSSRPSIILIRTLD